MLSFIDHDAWADLNANDVLDPFRTSPLPAANNTLQIVTISHDSLGNNVARGEFEIVARRPHRGRQWENLSIVTGAMDQTDFQRLFNSEGVDT